MKLEGILSKHDKYWLAEVPALDILTQSKTKQEGYTMAKDAIESLSEKSSLTVNIEPVKGSLRFYVSADDNDQLIALLLRGQRQKHGLTLEEVAKRLGAKSINSFARYEQGKSCPSIKKLTELLKAINPNLGPILKLAA